MDKNLCFLFQVCYTFVLWNLLLFFMPTESALVNYKFVVAWSYEMDNGAFVVVRSCEIIILFHTNKGEIIILFHNQKKIRHGCFYLASLFVTIFERISIIGFGQKFMSSFDIFIIHTYCIWVLWSLFSVKLFVSKKQDNKKIQIIF